VAGGANNQLKDTDKHMRMLMDRGILYAPDFVINAGGLINVYSELEGYNRQNALSKTEHIYDQTLAIFEAAQNEGISTLEASVRIARRRIDAVANIKTRL
jgi:leucine dehydrogenase